MKVLLSGIVVLVLAGVCLADEDFAEPADSAAAVQHGGAAAPVEPESHPTPAPDPRWARSVVTLIVALFIAAIPIGIIVRSNMPPDAPATANDDLHPPADDQHGNSTPGHH